MLILIYDSKANEFFLSTRMKVLANQKLQWLLVNFFENNYNIHFLRQTISNLLDKLMVSVSNMFVVDTDTNTAW